MYRAKIFGTGHCLGPFTPRFDWFSWDYWTFGSVYPTIWRVFVGFLVKCGAGGTGNGAGGTIKWRRCDFFGLTCATVYK